MAKAPAYQMYAADFSTATAGWPSDDVCAHIRLMNSQWINDGLADDLRELAVIAGLSPRKFGIAWIRLEARYPICADGKRRNVRLEEERKKQQEYRDKQATAAAMRWHKPAISQTPCQTDALQSSSSTTKPKKSKTNPSVAIAPVDERKAPIREAIKKGYAWRNENRECPWGPAEEVILSKVLADVPKSYTSEFFVECVRNKFKSDEGHGSRPREWLNFILSYADSPKDRFGKPKTLGESGNGNGKTNKATERFNSNIEAIAKGFGLRNRAPDGAVSGELAEFQHQPGDGKRLEGTVARDDRPLRIIDADGGGESDGALAAGVPLIAGTDA